MSEFLLNPAYVFFAAALLAAVVPTALTRLLLIATPIVGAVLLFWLRGTDGGFVGGQVDVLGMTLTTIRVDGLSFVFALIFHIAAALAGLYAFGLRDKLEQTMTLVYAGAAIGAALAGDLATLFIHWELTAVSSALILWAARTPESASAGMRYLIIQVLSGMLLLAGVVVHVHATGDLTFDAIGLDAPGGWLILLGFGIKCAFPFLHNWLQDSYPRATVTGAVTLSAFSTKLAVYALARSYAGESILIPIGVVMTLFPIVYAVIENDLRRVLAYSLNNQLGFMVVGVGIGTEMALNGAAAHAFAHILYKGLLFMSMGAVLHRTGTILASELGGLHKVMPVTTVCCIIGALSIAGFPLFSGFVTKSMTMDAVYGLHNWWIWGGLMIASAGVVDHSGIKIPFFAFFAHDQRSKIEARTGVALREAPWYMCAAMIATAGLCIGIGLFPGLLYGILPHAVEYTPYTAGHVIEYVQLLLFAALAFVVLYQTGRYPHELRRINLDFDWVYRKPAARLATLAAAGFAGLFAARDRVTQSTARHVGQWMRGTLSATGAAGSTARSGSMVIWSMLALIALLLTALVLRL